MGKKENSSTKGASRNQGTDSKKLTPREIEAKSRSAAAKNRADMKNSKNVENILNDITAKKKKASDTNKTKKEADKPNINTAAGEEKKSAQVITPDENITVKESAVSSENADKKSGIELQIINIELPSKKDTAETQKKQNAEKKVSEAKDIKRETVKRKNASAAISFENGQKENGKKEKTVKKESSSRTANEAVSVKKTAAEKAEKSSGMPQKKSAAVKPEGNRAENKKALKKQAPSAAAEKKESIDENNGKETKRINPSSRIGRAVVRRSRAVKISLFPVLKLLSAFFYEVGFYTEYASVLAGRFLKKACVKAAQLLKKTAVFLLKPFRFVIIEAWETVAAPFRRMHRGFVNIRQVIRDQKENGFKKVRQEASVYFRRGVKDYHHLVTNLVMWALAFASIIAFIVTVSKAFGSEYVLELKVNDNIIGYVKNEEVFEAAKQNLESQMIYTKESDETLTFEPIYSIVSQGDNKVSNAGQILNSLLDNSGKDIQTATGLYVDGVFYGATTEAQRLKNALDAMKEPYYDGDADTTVEFVQDVQLVEGVYIADSVVPYSALDEMLGSTVQGEVNYVIQSGDTLSGIASANGITQNELLALNPQYANDAIYYPGDVLVISKAQSFLQVKVVKRIVEQVAIPHGTTQTQSDSVNFGVRKVVVPGVDGSKDVTSDITYIDGIAVDKTIINEVVTLEPITEEVVIGTYLAPGIAGVPGSGQLMWPVPGYNYMSRGFAGLYPAHNGIDICANYGTPIYASDNGVVTRARYTNTGYGVHVMINHGNGLSTVYAHCSSLTVTEGQYVTKGQIIGYVGSTGWSTGNHCHYEVRVNNVTVNPLGGYVSP